jgi:hypothetical protein
MELGKIIYVLMIGVLIVIWWVGIWGLIETGVHYYARNSIPRALTIYSLLVTIVFVIIFYNPVIVDHFI